jgi:hypothetical protein
MLLIMVSFSQCSSAQKLQNEAPSKFGLVYFQTWVAGASGGGSGLNLFIPVMDSTVRLDSVYFRGNVSKLEVKPSNPTLHIGRFNTGFNQARDIVMHSDPNEEYTNKLSKPIRVIPFELKYNECVVSYTKGGKMLYYKIPNVIEKAVVNYPSAPPNINNN